MRIVDDDDDRGALLIFIVTGVAATVISRRFILTDEEGVPFADLVIFSNTALNDLS